MTFLFLFLYSFSIIPQSVSPDSVLYQSDAFTVFNDRVHQGEYEAIAIDRTTLLSTYRSAAKTNVSSTISFKFSLNGKDNEAAPGQDHQLTILQKKGEFVSPIYTFGGEDPSNAVQPDAPKLLPANTEATIRVDMSEVLKSFADKGFYEAWSGETISEDEFRGVYIAGSAEPLSWDFDNLHKNSAYKLSDDNNDGVYEGTFIFNPYDPDANKDKTWNLQSDISAYPGFRSDQVLVDALYNLALDETQLLIEDDSTFRTGKEWDGVWTRDISYSVLLSYAFIEPEISKKSLMRKVNRGRIIQDTGSGGAWPVSTDRVVWSIAAWELYKVTGDREWLENVYEIIKNTLDDDLQTVFDERYGLFKGESSFLDWREQTYPQWMDNVDISQSITLGTNAVYVRTFELMGEMAEELNKKEDHDFYANFSKKLRVSFNKSFWNEEKGIYNQYLYGRHFLSDSERFEALGASLSVLFGIADEDKIGEVIANSPAVAYGIPTIFPQIPNVPPYHNNGIWPFVQSYWNWAAATAGNQDALQHGLGSLYRAAALFLTNKENFVAETGDYAGTQINSDYQQWSVAGNLAMIYRVFLGMEFHPDVLSFSPVVPESYAGTKQVKGFQYRDATLDITVNGIGNNIKAFILDGNKLEKAEIPGSLKGQHTITIELGDSFEKQRFKVVENRFSLPEPRVNQTENTLNWSAVERASRYFIFKNGDQIDETQKTSFQIMESAEGFYQISAVDKSGVESFKSEPISYFLKNNVMNVQVEEFVEQLAQNLNNVHGSGAVEISKDLNRTISIPVNIPKSGSYLIAFRYSNGTGPWNTDNNCAIRTLKIDDKKQGTILFPQRGEGEWSNWGMSNFIKTNLNEGGQHIEVHFESSNENMDGEINKALLDALQLMYISE
jgi:hypothetical protein